MLVKTLVAALAVASLAASSATAQEAAAPTPAPASAVVAKGDVIQTLQAAGNFSTLLKTLDMTNLTGLLKRPEAISLFAPTDAAFAALPAGELSRLMQPANAAELQRLLVGHIFNGPLDPAALDGKNGPVDNAGGGKIYVDGSVNPHTVDGGTLLQPGLKVSNGTVFVIDKVLTPGYTPPPAEPAAPAQ